MESRFTILPAKPEHSSEVLEIIAKTLGKGYGNSNATLVAMEASTNKVVAFAYARVSNSSGVEVEKTGHLEVVAVDPDYQKSGIGLELSKGLVKHLSELGCDLLMCFAWYYKDGERIVVNSKKVLDILGFNQVFDLMNIYTDVCCSGVFKCPAKKDVGCNCGAYVYVKTLKELSDD